MGEFKGRKMKKWLSAKCLICELKDLRLSHRTQCQHHEGDGSAVLVTALLLGRDTMTKATVIKEHV